MLGQLRKRASVATALIRLLTAATPKTRCIIRAGGPSFCHKGCNEDQRGRDGADAYRDQWQAGLWSKVRAWRWWRVEAERPGHMVPPKDFEIDDAPTEYPSASSDPSQPSHGGTSKPHSAIGYCVGRH